MRFGSVLRLVGTRDVSVGYIMINLILKTRREASSDENASEKISVWRARVEQHTSVSRHSATHAAFHSRIFHVCCAMPVGANGLWVLRPVSLNRIAVESRALHDAEHGGAIHV